MSNEQIPQKNIIISGPDVTQEYKNNLIIQLKIKKIYN